MFIKTIGTINSESIINPITMIDVFMIVYLLLLKRGILLLLIKTLIE